MVLHIWELECSTCGGRFYMFVPDGKKPNDDVSCIDCRLRKGKDGIIVATNTPRVSRLHFGWDYDPDEYIPSMVDIVEEIEEGD